MLVSHGLPGPVGLQCRLDSDGASHQISVILWALSVENKLPVRFVVLSFT